MHSVNWGSKGTLLTQLDEVARQGSPPLSSPFSSFVSSFCFAEHLTQDLLVHASIQGYADTMRSGTSTDKKNKSSAENSWQV